MTCAEDVEPLAGVSERRVVGRGLEDPLRAIGEFPRRTPTAAIQRLSTLMPGSTHTIACWQVIVDSPRIGSLSLISGSCGVDVPPSHS